MTEESERNAGAIHIAATVAWRQRGRISDKTSGRSCAEWIRSDRPWTECLGGSSIFTNKLPGTATAINRIGRVVGARRSGAEGGCCKCKGTNQREFSDHRLRYPALHSPWVFSGF